MNWYPFRELETLRREIDKTFEQFGFGPRFSQKVISGGNIGRSYPLVNLRETPEAVVVEALAPGMDPDSLRVSVTRNVLTLSGEKPAPKVDEESFHRAERHYGKFTRTFELPTDIDADKISAEYKHGVLHITMQKAEAAKPRQIDVKIG